MLAVFPWCQIRTNARHPSVADSQTQEEWRNPMAITSVTRWKIDADKGRKLASEAAPLLKKNGASAVRVGYCHSGQFTGQTMVVVIYPDWQAYGKAMEAQSQDSAYQKLFGQVLGVGELLDRTVMVTHDL
jgi:hypothetical protein